MIYTKIENCWLEKVEEYARLTPDALAIVAAGEEATYSELYFAAQAFAEHLSRLGIREGDEILCRASNTVSYIIAYCGTLYIKAVFVPLEKNVKRTVLEDIYNRLERCVLVIGEERDRLDGSLFIGTSDISGVCKGFPESPYPVPPRDVVSHILFTTGSTGKSKGVVTTNEQFCECIDFSEILEFDQSTVNYVYAPVNHYGFFALFICTLVVGGVGVISQGLVEIKDFFDSLDLYGVNAVYSTPSMVNYIVSLADEAALKKMAKQLRSISMAGEKCPASLQKKLLANFPDSQVVVYYGATETGSISHYFVSTYGVKESCVGEHNPEVEIILKEVEGLEGEYRLCVKTHYCMKEYYRDPAQTAEIYDGVIMQTDDRAYFADGQYFVTGRLSDVIISGGYKIDPAEVESIALRHEAVLQCVCVAKPHPILGFVPKLVVSVKEGKTLDKNELLAILFDVLEDYKVPREIEVVNGIKSNASGKIDRKYYSENK